MFLYSKWTSLSLPLRIKLAYDLGIPKKHPTHVDTNRIVSDGYDIKDVETALTSEALHNYLGIEETDPTILWDLLVEKLEGREVATEQLPEVALPVPSGSGTEIVAETPIKKRGRPSKTK